MFHRFKLKKGELKYNRLGAFSSKATSQEQPRR
jgi:hypothetical protein